jgi:hypothetical protein
LAIIDTLLTAPVPVLELKAKGASLETQLDGVFANMLRYAKLNWRYVASGKDGGDALLAGTSFSAPCGGIATALMTCFIDGLGVAKKDVEYVRVTGYVWTGPQWMSFDPNVTGNIRKLDTPGLYNNGCIFNEHYYLKCNGKYYDPCLSSSYVVKDQSIKEYFNGLRMPMTVGQGRKFMYTADRKTCILYMPNETVSGFTGAYTMFDATKKNIEKALGTPLFKEEMARQSGKSSFATFVNSLR